MTEPSLDEIVRLESAVWAALVAGHAETDERLLSADFLGVYPTGFSDRDEVVAQLAHGPTVAEYELSEARLLIVSPDDVMLSYRSDFRRAGAAATGEAEAMYVSSLWCRRDGEWVNVFSQDTPASNRPVP